jgi:hypothetical protein
MNALADWVDEHWEAIVLAVALVFALMASAVLAVAYNVTAARWDAPVRVERERPGQPDPPGIPPFYSWRDA